MAGSFGLLLARWPTAFQGRRHRQTNASRRHWKAILRTGLIALLAVVPSSGAMAQIDRSDKDIDTAGLVIEATAGWDGTVDRSTPIPVSFLIGNNSDRIIEGHLTLSDPINGHEVTLGEVVVGPGTTRRFTSIQAMTDWFECFATLSDGEQVLWRRELALTTGKEFFANVNFALFIDASGRKLQLPGALSNTAAIAAAQIEVAGEQGRPVQCLTVKSWQVPNHPGPLVVAQAMIFPEGAAEADLNRVQWRAVAEWMCLGGTVFVHSESREIIDRLTDSAPLGEERPAQSGEFMVRRVGLGAIYAYPRPLFDSEGSEIRQLIAETTAILTKNHIGTLVDSGNLHSRRRGRADVNRILVVAFFGFYTFLTGVVALFLFRLSQRRIAAYTVIVVVGASVLSGLLGGLLRFSQGDLRWMTVTQAGAGGVVQVGRIDVQSAGGRNTQVAIKGERADLQFIGRARRYYSPYSPYSPYRRQTGYSPFTWQPNLAKGEDDTYQINVPMTPWGVRRLHATAFKRELRRLDFELEFEPHDPPSDGKGEQAGGNETEQAGGNEAEQAVTPPGMPSGVFSLKLVNHLPFDLTTCWLVIGVTHKSAAQVNSNQATSPRGSYLQASIPTPVSGQAAASTVGGLIDVYHMYQLLFLAAGATYEDAFEAEFQVVRNNWEMARSWPRGSLTLPRIARLGTASAWLIGRIENSPIMVIDEQRSDFVSQEQFHLFVQEILPEDMPDASLFLGTGEGAAIEAAEPGTR